MNLKAICLRLGVAVLACMPVAAQINYTFTDVTYKTDTFTQLLAINDANIIAGYHGATINKGFTYDLATKTFTDENFPGSVQTQVTGINDAPIKTVGFYIDGTGHNHGFQEFEGKFTRTDYPGQPFTQLLGQNNNGQSVGFYNTKADMSGTNRGFLYDEIGGGVWALFSLTNALSAQATGINEQSNICGLFVDNVGNTHGWLLVQGTFTQLDFKGATATTPFGLNKAGIVVGSYTDSAGTHGFTYNSATKEWQSIDAPGSSNNTVVNGINNNGVLVGFFGNSPDNTGFVAVPE